MRRGDRYARRGRRASARACRREIGAWLLAAFACTSCETTRGRATWSDVDDRAVAAGDRDQASGEPHVDASNRGEPTPGASTTVQAAGSDAPPATSGRLIDRALVDLLSARSRARLEPRSSGLWTTAWSNALDTIDEALQLPPVASDLGAFVRARVTLEVELDHDVHRGVILPDDVARRVTRTLAGVDESVQELRAANAPGTLTTTPRLSDGDLILRAPVAPMIVSSPFGRRHDPFTGQPRYHAGVDLDAPEGSVVYAAASGIVVYAGLQGGYGRYVVIDHGDGVRTHYAHLSELKVEIGTLVVEGDVVGLVGSTGRSTGPHLHFAVTNLLGEFLDPLAVLDIPLSTMDGQVVTRR